jgi:hypothetical protein
MNGMRSWGRWRHTWGAMWAAGVVLAGCYDSPPGPAGDGDGGVDDGGADGGEGGDADRTRSEVVWSTPGTRLRPRILRTAEGLRVPYDVFDATLGVACAPLRQSDGTRCVPDVRSVSYGDFFRDEACGVRLALDGWTTPAPVGSLVGQFAHDGCFRDLVSLDRIEEVIEPGTPVFQVELGTGACLPVAAPSLRLYAVREVPDRPVALREERMELDGRIAARLLVGGDGSRLLPGDFFDTALDTPVTPDATARLLPPRFAWGDLQRRDPPPEREGWPGYCDGRGDFIPYDLCEVTTLITHISVPATRGIAAEALEVFKVKPHLATSHRCQWGHGEVVAVSSVAGEGLILDGQVPLDGWVRGERAAVGDGRFFIVDPGAPDRALAIGGRLLLRPEGPATQFVDAELSLRCRPTLAADGNLRCLPDPVQAPFPAAVVRPAYLDAACTELVGRSYSGETRPVYVLLPFGASLLPGEPAAPTRAFPLGELVPPRPELFDKDASGACVAFAASPGDLFYRAGPEAPPETFGALQLEEIP